MFIKIVPYIAILLNVCIAYVYRKSSYNYFFFLLALNDLISLVLWNLFNISSQAFWIPLNYLLVFSIHKRFRNKWKIWVLIGLFPILILNYHSNTSIQHYFILIVNFALLFMFLRLFSRKIFSFNELNLFYLILIFYESLVIIRFIAIIADVDLGVNVFYVGVIIQILISIALLIIRKSVKSLES